MTARYFNYGGLRTKLDDIHTELNALSIIPDIFAICESNLYIDITDSELNFNDYQIFRKDRNLLTSYKKDGGVVLLCIKKQFSSIEIAVDNDVLEQIFERIPKLKLIIGLVYIPPYAS